MSKLLGSLAGTVAKVGGAVAAGALVVDQAVYTVEPGHRALIYSHFGGGIQEGVKNEGAHFIMPFIQVRVPWCCFMRAGCGDGRRGQGGGRRFLSLSGHHPPAWASPLPPPCQRPIFMDVRLQPRTISSVTGTKDLQSVNLSLRVLSRPNVPALPELYRKLGEDYQERILPSVGNEVLKVTTTCTMPTVCFSLVPP